MDLLILCSSNEGHLLQVHVGCNLHQAGPSPLAMATLVCVTAHSMYTKDIAFPNHPPDTSFHDCLAADYELSKSTAPQMALRLGNCVNAEKGMP